MRLYIIGPVGSGKTTLARRISALTGVRCHHLDDVVYVADPTDPWGNRKRPPAERDALFAAILAAPDYIVEDAGRDCFVEAMAQADSVVLLEPPARVRCWRIVRRWVRQNLGLERCGYRPRPAMLRAMFRWTRNYETGADGTRARAQQFADRLVVLRTRRDVERYLAALAPGSRRKI